MKKIIFLGVLSAFSLVKPIHGADFVNSSEHSYGPQKYGKEAVDSIQANGSVVLAETKVSGAININGSLSAESATMTDLHVNGQTDLKNCVVERQAVINGSLTAQNTRFQDSLSVAAQKIVLNRCSMRSLIIREVGKDSGIQIVDLRGGTTVAGSIVVESGKGQILVSSNSEISETQVSGAVIIRDLKL